MATGYGCVTGRGQLVLLHAAAGLLQGANAIHGALLTGAPMVVCSGESTGYGDAAGADPGSQWYRNLSVVGGPQAVAAPFTKWSNAAADVSVLYGMLKRAGELAAQAPAGPVYVNTPVEVLLAPWQPAATSPVPAGRGGSTVAVPEDVELAVRLLSAARRPVLAVETAGRDPAAFAALVELADLLALPVVEPQSAVSSSFPRGNPMHAGGDLAALAADADLVVLLGCRSPWYPPSAKPGERAPCWSSTRCRTGRTWPTRCSPRITTWAARSRRRCGRSPRGCGSGARRGGRSRPARGAVRRARGGPGEAARRRVEGAVEPPRGRSTRWPSRPRCAS